MNKLPILLIRKFNDDDILDIEYVKYLYPVFVMNTFGMSFSILLLLRKPFLRFTTLTKAIFTFHYSHESHFTTFTKAILLLLRKPFYYFYECYFLFHYFTKFIFHFETLAKVIFTFHYSHRIAAMLFRTYLAQYRSIYSKMFLAVPFQRSHLLSAFGKTL